MTIDGNGGLLTGSVQLYFGAIVQIRNVTLSNSNGSCLVATHKAYVKVDDLVTFGACTGGAQVDVSAGGMVELFKNFTLSGSATNFIANREGIVLEDGGTITVSNNITYSGAVIFGFYPGVTNLGAATWSLGGHTVTGEKYDIEANHVLAGSSSIPGTVAGTTASGGQAQ